MTRPDLPALLSDLQDEHRALRTLVEERARTHDDALDAPTPAAPWDVRDSISHLAGTDAEATVAALCPDDFRAALPGVAEDLEGFLTGQLTARRGLTQQQLLSSWADGFAEMVAAFGALAPGTSVPWYGPPMSPASFATARLMEYWAHGQDVADAYGVVRAPTGRLRHVCHLGVRTRAFAYRNRGLDVPAGDVRVVLAAPDGSTWTWGEGDDAVLGSAEDFCLLVTQRRARVDLGLRTTGPLADSWLDVAQAFAGPPGPGRAPLG